MSYQKPARLNLSTALAFDMTLMTLFAWCFLESFLVLLISLIHMDAEM